MFTSAEAANQRIALMLSGPACEENHEELRLDLEMIHGVQAVDLLSLPGFVLLDVETGAASPDELTSVINGGNRVSRQCRAQIMESCISTSQHSIAPHHR
jgi:hypothetical protein